MAGCCGSNKAQGSGASCCGGDKKKAVLLYACSGGANVAEIADKAARAMMFSGCGTMFCLAGIGAHLSGFVVSARDAEEMLVLDGCALACAADPAAGSGAAVPP